MTVRPAGLADADAIAVVHVRSWQAAYRGLLPQDLLDGLDPEQRLPGWQRTLTATAWPRRGVLVAVDGDAVVGFAGLGPSRDPDGDPDIVGEVQGIYLDPRVWSRGVGRELMAECVRILGEAGYRQATLWVLDGNKRARRFYEAAGWTPDGATRREVRHDTVLSEVRYRRALG
ncbi:MAG TPA: GNAT family N-acetyltransferase [Micromonosporaceae bacterium]